MKRLYEAVRAYEDSLGEVERKRITNELKWLLEDNRDPINDAMLKLFTNLVTVDIAVDLHDLIPDERKLTNTEKTKLHFAINLKVSRK